MITFDSPDRFFRRYEVPRLHLLGLGQEHAQCVVIDHHVPKECPRIPFSASKITQEPSREVNQMYPLIDTFSAARQFGLSAPFFLVIAATPMPIPASDEHEISENAGLLYYNRIAKRSMKPMVEANQAERICFSVS